MNDSLLMLSSFIKKPKETGAIAPSSKFLAKEIIKSIASTVKGWAGNWDAVYDNIILRGKVKQEIVEVAAKLGKPELMEAKFNTLANTAFHKISDEVREERGLPISDFVFPKWKEWLYKRAEEF